MCLDLSSISYQSFKSKVVYEIAHINLLNIAFITKSLTKLNVTSGLFICGTCYWFAVWTLLIKIENFLLPNIFDDIFDLMDNIMVGSSLI